MCLCVCSLLCTDNDWNLLVSLPIVDQFNKRVKCKLQGGLFIFFLKFSVGIFNTGGNCKLQFPQMKGGCVTLHFNHIKLLL